MSKAANKSDIQKFKRSIYIFSFCDGLAFWYAIEKLFMQSIEISLGMIILIGIIAQAGKMIFEIPSSILADRWNRRNTMVIGLLAMILASTFLPFTTSALYYALFALLWTVYYAFKSGTDTAFIFDSLKEMGDEGSFQQVLARFKSLENVGLILSSLSAGLIASFAGLQVPYWLTIAPFVIGVFVLLRLREPKIHQREEKSNFHHHAIQAWQDIKSNSLVWVVFLYAVLMALLFCWYEFYQIYGLAVNTPQVIFGSLLAVLCLGLIAGSEIVRRFKNPKRLMLFSWLAITLTHLGGVFFTDYLVFLIILFVSMVGMQIINLYVISSINHKISSKRRATIISLGGSASQLLFLGLAFIFKFVAEKWGAQTAFAFVSLPLLILGIIDILRRMSWVEDRAKKPV